MKIIFLLFIVFACAHVPKSREEIAKYSLLPLEEQIKPFRSDGCSVWPEGSKTNKTSWLKCCIVHDIAYWKGGTELEKEKSDHQLKECVEKNSSGVIGGLMEFGAGIGGAPKYKTPFKWGFGWKYGRGYLPLNSIEKAYIKEISPKKGEDLRKYLNLEDIDPEIKKVDSLIY